MADFSLAQIGEASGGASPQPGVQQPSAGVAALSFLETAGSALFEGIADQREKKQQLEINKSLTEFQNQQMRIADAVDRGDMSSQEARMQMRYNLTRAGANNPNLSAEFAKVHGTVLKTAGMGKVAAEGTEQEQAFFATQEAATKAGFVLPNMSQDEARLATIAWQDFKRQQELIADESAKVALSTAKIRNTTAGITQQTARLTLAEKQAAKRARDAMAAGADAYSVRFNNQSQRIQDMADNQEISAVEAVQMLDEEWAQIESTLTEVGRAGDATYLSNVLTPMRKQYEMRRGYLTGETPKEVVQAQTDLQQTVQQQMIISENPALFALSSLIDNSSPTLIAQLNNTANAALEKNSKEGGGAFNVLDSDNRSEIAPYYNVLSGGMDRINRGDATDPEKVQREIGTNLNKMLRAVGVNGSSVDSPSDFNEFINFAASDTYGEYVEKNGSAVRASNASEARIAVQEQYEAVVKPLIAEEWRNANELTMAVPDPANPETAGQTVGRSTIFKPMFVEGGVEFVYTNDSDRNPTRDRTLRQLNNKVRLPLMNLIKAGAHLSGNRNYKQIYESNYASLFGDAGTGTAQQEQ